MNFDVIGILLFISNIILFMKINQTVLFSYKYRWCVQLISGSLG